MTSKPRSYPYWTVKNREFQAFEEALQYWQMYGGALMEKLDSMTPAYVLKYPSER